MKVQLCADWKLCRLNKPEPALFKPQCFHLNSSEDACSTDALRATQCEHHGHVVEPMYTYVSEAVCQDVCLFCRSANERRGVSGFQVLVLWERRWVTGLMNSDVQQLLINQETVCQHADWNSSPTPCTRTRMHDNTCARGHADVLAASAQTHTHTAFISPSSESPELSVEQRPIPSFPPDSTSRMCLLSVCSHHSRRGKLLTEYGNTCQM